MNNKPFLPRSTRLILNTNDKMSGEKGISITQIDTCGIDQQVDIHKIFLSDKDAEIFCKSNAYSLYTYLRSKLGEEEFQSLGKIYEDKKHAKQHIHFETEKEMTMDEISSKIENEGKIQDVPVFPCLSDVNESIIGAYKRAVDTTNLNGICKLLVEKAKE